MDLSSTDRPVTLNYPSLPIQFGSEIIVDDGGGDGGGGGGGGGGEDIVIVNGTPERDEVFLTTDDGLIINDFDRVTRIAAHHEHSFVGPQSPTQPGYTSVRAKNIHIADKDSNPKKSFAA